MRERERGGGYEERAVRIVSAARRSQKGRPCGFAVVRAGVHLYDDAWWENFSSPSLRNWYMVCLVHVGVKENGELHIAGTSLSLWPVFSLRLTRSAVSFISFLPFFYVGCFLANKHLSNHSDRLTLVTSKDSLPFNGGPIESSFHPYSGDNYPHLSSKSLCPLEWDSFIEGKWKKRC